MYQDYIIICASVWAGGRGGGGEGRGVSLLYQMTDLHISWHTGLIGDYLATLLDTLYAIRKCKNANVLIHIIRTNLIYQWIQWTVQIPPLLLQLPLVWFHILWKQFSTFSAADVISQFSSFAFQHYQ